MTLFRNPPLILLAGEFYIIGYLLRYSYLPLWARSLAAAMMGLGALILQLVYWNQEEREA
jgi:hypothetical protein